MKAKLARTANLLRSFPALLAPLAVASWLSFYLEWFQKAATHYMLHHWLMGSSVLGFAVPQAEPTHEYVRRGMMVLLPFGLGMRVLILSVTLAAFVLTVRLAHQLDHAARLDWPAAWRLLRSKAGWVLAASVGLLVVVGLLAVLSAALVNLEALSFLRTRFALQTLLYVSLTVGGAASAWLLMPVALLLVRDRQSAAPPRETVLPCRIAALVTVVLLIVLQTQMSLWTPQINLALADAELLRSHIVWPLLTVVMNLPLGLLWVLLGVLTSGDTESQPGASKEPESVVLPGSEYLGGAGCLMPGFKRQAMQSLVSCQNQQRGVLGCLRGCKNPRQTDG